MNRSIAVLTITFLVSVLAVSFVQAQPTFDCSTIIDVPQSDCEALVALYDSTDGLNWTINSGWLKGIAVCDWHGVVCGDGRVTQLFLANNELSRSIPPELGLLSNLTYLDLRFNQLSGSIPPELGNLSKMERIFLNRNQLTGSIPPELGNLSALAYLDFDRNQLSGSIPSELGNLPKLRYFHLMGNRLTGQAPDTFIDRIIPHVDISYNRLTFSQELIDHMEEFAWVFRPQNEDEPPGPTNTPTFTPEKTVLPAATRTPTATPTPTTTPTNTPEKTVLPAATSTPAIDTTEEPTEPPTDTATPTVTATADATNPLDPNQDGVTGPTDAIFLINRIGQTVTGAWDTNDNNQVDDAEIQAILDALP